MANTGVYDVVYAYQRIEDELIDSMRRNMRRHMGQELDEGINWSQWQAEMLRGLQQYRAQNADMVEGYCSTINDKIDAAIREAYATGESEQEIEILQAIKRGYKPDKTGKGTDAMRGAFFGVNEDKLNALIKSTKADFDAANKAILRRTEDIYRQTIFNTQMYFNSGAGTLWQSVDRAAHDFLAQGINCIQYRNGARVNIASYSEMALRTANKRANLMGAGNKREQYGIHLVKVAAKGTACPMCLPFLGNVFIDDVYSGGKRGEATYPLLSSAIDAGLFHPNCKDGLSTYYEGVSRAAKGLTADEQKEALRRYDLEQQARKCERNIRKYTRLANGAIDADNARRYTAYKQQWELDYKKLIGKNRDVLRYEQDRLRLYGIDRINESTFNTPISIYKKPATTYKTDKLHPAAVAGAPLGKPMSFTEADSFNVNPNYDAGGNYSINCQSCVVTFEARQRGYDVQVLPFKRGGASDNLSCNTTLAWIDPLTGEHPKLLKDTSATTPKKFLKFMDSTVKQGERYTLEFGWRGRGRSGHIINLDRDDSGSLRLKDNQRGRGEASEWIGDKAVLQYLRRCKYTATVYGYKYYAGPALLRVDNMQFDLSVVNLIMEAVTK